MSNGEDGNVVNLPEPEWSGWESWRPEWLQTSK